MKKYILPLVLLLAPLFELHAQYSLQHFAQLYGLQGVWKTERRKGAIVEEWRKENDSTLIGKSYFITPQNDSIPEETVVLSLRQGVIVYSPTTANQNNQQPVDFTLVKIKDGRFDFENKNHDFPQLISYQLKGPDSLYASISGPTSQGNKKVLYNYAKQQ